VRDLRPAAIALAILLAGCFATPSPGRFSALAAPARSGDTASLQRLISAGANPNAADPGGNHWTPLLHAIHKRQPAAVDLLLRSGADPKLPVNGMPPLLMAVGTGDAPIVKRLLAAGADPKGDDTIFLTAVSGGALSDLDNPLLGRCSTDVVRALLARAPDLRLPRDRRGQIALMLARLNHCDAVVELAGRS
jgi:ankyrin repeat protein